MLSKNLAILREENGLTQSDLADAIGISRVSVSNYENGERTPDAETLTKYANYFNVSTDWLLDRIKKRTATSEDKYIKKFEGLDENNQNSLLIIQKKLIEFMELCQENSQDKRLGFAFRTLSDSLTGDILQFIEAYSMLFYNLPKGTDAVTLIKKYMGYIMNNNSSCIYNLISEVCNKSTEKMIKKAED